MSHTELLTLGAAINSVYTTGKKYYEEDDHWQNGAGWDAPSLPTTDPLYSQSQQNIKRMFCPQNVIAELVDNALSSLLGPNLTWQILATSSDEADIALASAANSLLLDWWQDNDLDSVLETAGVELMFATRGLLRMVVPRRFAALPPATDLKSALSRIFIHAPLATQANVAPHPTPMSPRIAIYTETGDRGTYTEEQYIDERGLTVIKVDQMTQANIMTSSVTTETSVSLPLGGMLLIYKMQIKKPYVTHSIMALQKAINLSITMGKQNVTKGTGETYFINAEPQVQLDSDGKPKIDPTTNLPILVPMYTGPGARNFLSGTITENNDGTYSVANSSIQRFEPISHEVYEKSQGWFYELALAQCRQTHLLLSAKATVSEESRKESKTAFVASMSPYITQFSLATRWILKAALALAGVLEGKPGKYDGLKISVTIKVNTGPLSEAEKAGLREDYKAGGLSLYNWLIERGWSDAEAKDEIQRLKDEFQERAQAEQAAMANAFVGEAQQVTQ